VRLARCAPASRLSSLQKGLKKNSDVEAYNSAVTTMNGHGYTRLWMAVAFCATLGLTGSAVAIFYTPHNNLGIALATSARVSFLLFWPAYVGSALTSLFGDVFLPLSQHARDLGLAFAAALLVHLGIVAYLCAVGHPPPAGTFVVFGAAAILTYLLALLSIGRVRRAMPRAFWPFFRAVAMNYIAFAFLKDFVKFPLSDLRNALLYLPFAGLATIGPMLKLAAWMQKMRYTRAAPAD
jgi:hypothetical protein